MNYNEFAEQVKKKYPDYANVDNKTLAEKMVQKYPAYKNQVIFDEEPPKPQPLAIQDKKEGVSQQEIQDTITDEVNDIIGQYGGIPKEKVVYGNFEEENPASNTLQGKVSQNVHQEMDAKGRVHYIDENGNEIKNKLPLAQRLGRKIKAWGTNTGAWINDTNPEGEAYKQKISLVTGLMTLPIGGEGFAVTKLGTGLIGKLTPYFGKRIASDIVKSAAAGGGSGLVEGGVRGILDKENPIITAIQDGIIGLAFGGAAGAAVSKGVKWARARKIKKLKGKTDLTAEEMALVNKYYSDYELGKKVVNKNQEVGKIELPSQGMKETMNQQPQKAGDVVGLSNSLKDADYMGVVPKTHDNKFGNDKFYHIKHKGNEYIIANNPKNKKKYFHIIKDLDLTEPRSDGQSLNNIIAGNIDDFNPTISKSEDLKNITKKSVQDAKKEFKEQIVNELNPQGNLNNSISTKKSKKGFYKMVTDPVGYDMEKTTRDVNDILKEIKNNPEIVNDAQRVNELENRLNKTLEKWTNTDFANFAEEQANKYWNAIVEAEKFAKTSKDYSTLANRSLKTRGAIETIEKKINSDVADAVTDREYLTRGLEVNKLQLEQMPQEEVQKLINSDDISDLSITARALDINKDIENGKIPLYKLNKWASEGTPIGQAMQARSLLNLSTPQGALAKMVSVINESAPKVVRKLKDDTSNLVKNINKVSNEEIEEKFYNWLEKLDAPQELKKYNSDGDKLALLKAMENYRRKKAKQAETIAQKASKTKEKDVAIHELQLVREEEKAIKELQKDEEKRLSAIENMLSRTITNAKERKTFAEKILKLKNLNGLDEESFTRLVDKHYKLPEITDVDLNKINELTANLQNATGDYEQKVAEGLLNKYIADKVPKKFWDKVNSYRYQNMLLSGKSRIKDALLTGINTADTAIDESIASVIDAARSKITGSPRVISNLHPKEWFNGLKKGFKEGVNDVKLGINTSRSGERARYGLPSRYSFDFKPVVDAEWKNIVNNPISNSLNNTLAGGERALNYSIRVPDRMFYEGRYASSLADQLESAGLKEPTQEIIEQAAKEARESVYQDDSWVNKLGLLVRKGLNMPSRAINDFTDKNFVPNIGDWVEPFVTTPANIANQGLKNTFGGIPAAIKLATNKNMLPEEIRDAEILLAKNIKGIAPILAGIAIGKGKIDSNIGNNNYAENEISGLKPQSIVIGDKAISLKDYPQMSIPMAFGKGVSDGGITQGVLNAGKAVTDMSSLKSIGDLVNTVQSGRMNELSPTEILDNVIRNQGVNAASQLIPFGGAMGELRNDIDPYARELYTKNTPQYILNRVQNRIPFASQALPVKYNAIGEPVMANNIENPVLRALSEGIDLGIRNNKKNDTYNTINQFADEIKDTDIKGRSTVGLQKSKRTIKVNGENVKLNNKQYSNYQKEYGKLNYLLKKQAINSERYKTASNEERAEYLAELRRSIEEAVKIKQFGHKPSRNKKKYTDEILEIYDKLLKE